jgi:uncharacterized protein (DUF736 family)
MDKFVLKPNSGNLFNVPTKAHAEAPDYRGEIKLAMDGLEIEDGYAIIKIAGWKSKSKTSGNTYLSLKVDQWKPTAQKPQPKKEEDDDIPF